MEDNYKYKIIQAVDPTKIKVPINDKFGKLTLSSNKKKKANLNAIDIAQDISNGIARNRVSRNLMKELSGIASQPQNPLLCSGTPEKELEDRRESSAVDAPYVTDSSNSNLHYAAKFKSTETINSKHVENKLSPSKSLESEIICVSSSEKTKTYDENSVISLSETNESNSIHEPVEMLLSNVTTNNSKDYNENGNTTNERGKRLKAFLDDVALEYHNRAIEDTLNDALPHDTLMENGTNSSEMLKCKRIATADTESMTVGSEIDDKIFSAILEREKRLKALDNSLSSSMSLKNITKMSPGNNEVRSSSTQNDEHKICNAYDDVDDTTHIDESINTSAQIPIESVVISETDDDANDDDNSNDDSRNEKAKIERENQQKERKEKTNSTIFSSKNSFSTNDDSECNEMINDSTAPSHSDLDDLEIKMGNINLSAKIKVNIQIRSESPESEENEMNADGSDKCNNTDDSSHNNSDYLNVSCEKNQEQNSSNIQGTPNLKKHTKETITTPPTSISNDSVLERSDYQKSLENNQNMLATTIDATKTVELTEATTDSNTSELFISQAEKILSQLYGNTWQTPEVIRTLNCIAPTDSQIKLSLEKSVQKEKNCNANSTVFSSTGNTEKSVEESVLDDFSIFRRNIDNHLNSTRCPTSMRKRNLIAKEKVSHVNSDFKISLASVNANVKRNQKQRKLIFDDKDQFDDSSNSSNNASDDSDIDWTQGSEAINEELLNSDMTESSDNDDYYKKKRSVKKKTKSSKDHLSFNKYSKNPNQLIYLDLSKKEVEIQEIMQKSPPANRNENFMTELQDILQTCRRNSPIKLPSVRSETKSRRKLFNPNFVDEDSDLEKPQTPKNTNVATIYNEHLNDSGYLPFDCRGIFVNKRLELVKTGNPIFAITPPSKQKNILKEITPRRTPRTSKKKPDVLQQDSSTQFKYNFLKSLDVSISKSLCHPDALIYRENYRAKKEELCQVLYDLYNEKVFDNKLDVPITWNKKLCNTAGRCLNRKRMSSRFCTIELSDKVLTSADRLRCTLIHEMCHAASWIFNGEGGHGATWRSWAQRSNTIFPEIPKIGVCHQYDIEYKYTYKCSLCGAKSHAHSKSKKVENIRCACCHGAIEIFLNKKDKEGNIMQVPVKEAKGFAKFVKDNYKKYKRDDLKHSDVMKTLSNEFAAMKMTKV